MPAGRSTGAGAGFGFGVFNAGVGFTGRRSVGCRCSSNTRVVGGVDGAGAELAGACCLPAVHGAVGDQERDLRRHGAQDPYAAGFGLGLELGSTVCLAGR